MEAGLEIRPDGGGIEDRREQVIQRILFHVANDFQDFVSISNVTIDAGGDSAFTCTISCDGKQYVAKSETLSGLIKASWAQVANDWLAKEAHKEPMRKLTTKQKNPWTRSDRHMPAEISEREEYIRWKMWSGWKQNGESK